MHGNAYSTLKELDFIDVFIDPLQNRHKQRLIWEIGQQ